MTVKVPVKYITKRQINPEIYLFIEGLMKLRDDKKPWEAIDKIVRFYKKNYQQEYKESVGISKRLCQSRGDEWGRGDKLLHKEARRANIRMVLNIPFRLIAIIRKVYNEQEMPFDRKFLKKFGSKYPEFLVPRKGVKSFS